MQLYFLGLDAFAAKLVFAPEHAGRWPNIEGLCQTSLHGPSECEPDFAFTGPSWTSIYTGQPASIHGVTDLWGRPINGGRSFQTVREPFIWDLLNRNGLTCGVVTMPITYPARRIKGYMISGFPSPRLSVTGDIQVSPDFLVDHSQRIRKTKPIPGIGYAWHDEHPLEEDLELLKASELAKAEVILDLLGQQPVDCFFVQYSCLDRVGHELNNYARRGLAYEPRHVIEMYDWFDSILLPLLLKVEADNMVITSDHGWQDCDGYGQHEIQGMFLAKGPDIPQGMRIDCRNIDVLPTVMDILGLPPVDAAGHSILMRQSDLDQINEQLSGLGYI